jgi:hypothetical protein
MKRFFLILLILPLLLILSYCHHDANLTVAPPKPTHGTEFKCVQYSSYFENMVLPTVLSGCAKTGCHDQATQKGDLVLVNYADISRLVVPFDPQNSALYYRLFSNSEGRMPPDIPLSSEQKSIIYWWIQEGAYDNRCDSIICDSVNVTYDTTIQPILQTWCTGCHGGSNPSNGLSLETYDQVVACANSGRLMGAINQEQGYKTMPQGGYKLSPCEINLFQKWINIGMP